MIIRAAVTAILVAVTCQQAAPARAIMSGQESRLAPSGDADYAAGRAAFEREDWSAAIGHLTLVLIRRPWHDNALTMVGHSWLELGDHDRSLAAYHEALAINPLHRGATEYLGEAYLEMGLIEEANAQLIRLVQLCNDVVMAFNNTGWKSGCEELDELTAAYAARSIPLPATD